MATSARTYQILEDVYNLLLDGKQRKELIAVISEKYGISAARIDRYIKDANEDVRRFSESNKEKSLKRQLQRYESLYEETREKELYKESLQALQQIDKLENLVTQKVDLTSGGEKITGVVVQIVRPEDSQEK